MIRSLYCSLYATAYPLKSFSRPGGYKLDGFMESPTAFLMRSREFWKAVTHQGIRGGHPCCLSNYRAPDTQTVVQYTTSATSATYSHYYLSNRAPDIRFSWSRIRLIRMLPKHVEKLLWAESLPKSDEKTRISGSIKVLSCSILLKFFWVESTLQSP